MNKESASKIITINLDLHNQDDEEEKPLEHDKTKSSLRERRSTRLWAEERKEENIKVDNTTNVKIQDEIYDLEKDDNFVDNLEDEDFQEEKDDTEEDFKEEMEEDEEWDEISKIEEDSDTSEQSLEVPNLSDVVMKNVVLGTTSSEGRIKKNKNKLTKQGHMEQATGDEEEQIDTWKYNLRRL
ncbi:uncharacterized protein LOC131876710 [Cryptomeria japonica]|uniref:uncharacterized protein LOC131876710 n=1 Tax=Cryptomeria japonica TaxID=3369 RepID=UPI0027DA3DCE|nr:uncharacterized protein LOC131876710 [Cryptomeria japonica]